MSAISHVTSVGRRAKSARPTLTRRERRAVIWDLHRSGLSPERIVEKLEADFGISLKTRTVLLDIDRYQAELTEDPIIRPTALVRILGLDYSTIYRQYKDGKFPQPIQLGKRSIGWRKSTVDRELAARQREATA
jgi:prophage regulatory protein